MSKSIRVATAFERSKPTAVAIGDFGFDLEPLAEVVDILGQYESASAAGLRSLKPDIIIFVIDLNVLNGVEIVRRLSQEFRGINVIIVTDAYHAIKYHNQLMRAGAQGFCKKSSGVAALIEATQAILRGQQYCDPGIQRLVKQSPSTSMSNCNLTDREIEVLKLFNFSDVVIAERLDMKLRTVEKHIECILAKLQAPTRTAAFLKGLALGLINPRDDGDDEGGATSTAK